MPKEKKQKKLSEARQSLGEQIVKASELKTKNKPAPEKDKKQKNKPSYVSASLSKKILTEARNQLQEKEFDESEMPEDDDNQVNVDLQSENEEDYGAEDYVEYEAFLREDAAELEATSDDLKLFERFLPKQSSQPKKTLADLIMEKIEEKQQSEMDTADPSEAPRPSLNPKVVEIYTQVGKALSHYSSGKIPKAFKVIGSLSNWEQILFLTSPDKWSAPAFFQATKIFASNLNSHMAQRYYNLILLPKVQDDIREHKKLNFHLYMSLKKALFKPAAFYKGIVLPLCESGDCTLREAVIIASVLAKVSIPVLHSSAALLKLCQMEYAGCQSIFIKKLLDKKYSLPQRVVQAILEHFLQFVNVPPPLPVLWHQALLIFVQRYKNDLVKEHRDGLKAVLQVQNHHQISEEIRRELFHSNPGS